jgi:DNA integrity scanning protein DisA with diadenylate cyclase activity
MLDDNVRRHYTTLEIGRYVTLHDRMLKVIHRVNQMQRLPRLSTSQVLDVSKEAWAACQEYTHEVPQDIRQAYESLELKLGYKMVALHKKSRLKSPTKRRA